MTRKLPAFLYADPLGKPTKIPDFSVTQAPGYLFSEKPDYETACFL